MRHPAARWSLVALGYLALALVITWPLALHLGDRLLGTPGMDQVDTAWLRLAAARWLTGQDPGVFAPVGYALPQVIPNWVDHLLGAPFALLLPWPLGDNLWWLLVLAANGLAGHVLGRQVGGSHGAGALCGVAFACCEPVLREANLSHAPQALVCWAPLFLAALLRSLEPEGRLRHALLAGMFLAFSALTYWYQGLFLVVLAAPVVISETWRQLRAGRLQPPVPHRVLAVVLCLALCALPLYLALGSAPDLAGLSTEVMRRIPGQGGSPVPTEHAWSFLHGSGPAWPFLAEPGSTSSRLSLVLLGAALWGAWRSPRHRWAWLVAAVAGGLLLMGPYLQVAGRAVRLGGHLVPLPGLFLAELSDALARLHWPLRWGVIVPLALLPLAARAPRPAIWAGALLVEVVLLSSNAPVASSPVDQLAGWRVLSASPGPVLVLPQEIAADGPSSTGLILRAAGCPLANELGIPPRASQPLEFRRWQDDLELRGWWRFLRATGRFESPPPAALEQLRQEGIAAVALDVTPGGYLSPHENQAIAALVAKGLGEPDDHGAVLLWWLAPPPSTPAPMENGAAWRSARHEALVRDGERRTGPRPGKDAPPKRGLTPP